MTPIAILSALADEQDGFVHLLQDTQQLTHAGRTFWRGKLHGADVICVLSGIGTVAAATTAVALIERFGAMIESNGGTVEKTDEWGKRHLAYPINDKTEGYYVLMSFTCAPEVPKELERNFKNDEAILRYLVTRKGE